jgi:hypothetical protein
MLSDLKSQVSYWVITMIKDNGWWDEIASHIIYDGPTIWTDEEVLKICYQFNSMGNLQKKYSGVAKYLYRNPHIKEEMDIYWARCYEQKKKDSLPKKEDCHQKALNFTNKTDFRKSYYGLYEHASRNGWIDEICSHMFKKGSNYGNLKWTYEKCKEESLKYQYKCDLSAAAKGCYSSIKNNKWDELLSHMPNKKEKDKEYTGKYTKEMLIEIAAECKHRSDFQDRFSGAFKVAKKLNCLNELFPFVNKEYIGKYTKEMLIEIVSTCKNISDFQNRFSGAYKAAKKLNCLNELFPK